MKIYLFGSIMGHQAVQAVSNLFLILPTLSETSLSEKAVSLFHQKPTWYNCAQAVAAAVERKDLVETLKSCGGGRAPGGLCGALYAATLFAEEKECNGVKNNEVKEQFQNVIGHTDCKTIRHTGKFPCRECVRCAAEIVTGILAENASLPNN